MSKPDPLIVQRLSSLESHLQDENPVLLEVVKGFRDLDAVAYKMGVLSTRQSFATMIPWWPLISVLGTFSAGKSSFINHYLGYELQSSGNQAVDDRFTVICHSKDGKVHTLPGLALDADPRFPFYQISNEIDKVAQGEGKRIDTYLQLKTCPSDLLLGKIMIDSPGFDADAQRTSTLRLTEHIVDLSDLVLVFFDARHPEPGAMRDTLKHLVRESLERADSSKFLYILNQIDAAAREDNPEEVFGAWQRALAQEGLTAGRFYTIYNPKFALQIEDNSLRERFERKRDIDLSEIHSRIQQVKIERAYRIVGALEAAAGDFSARIVPVVTEALARWRKRVLITDAVLLAIFLVTALLFSVQNGWWVGFSFVAPWFIALQQMSPIVGMLMTALVFGAGALIHFKVRDWVALGVARWVEAQGNSDEESQRLLGAFTRSSSVWRSLFNTAPTGWGRRTQKRLDRIIATTDSFVQKLNDSFANPSGHQATDFTDANVTQEKL
ncbi:MAG: dynamin family protein [Gammaproteobacteria bacterium]|nr:dynamin family protein [Gammaproteobacteria bacterium]